MKPLFTSKMRGSVGLIASAALGGLLVFAHQDLTGATVSPPRASAAQPETDWVAVGPGLVEPLSGERKIVAPVAGQLRDVMVRPHELVREGTLLAVIDDSEQQARVRAAETEVKFREAERDAALSSGLSSAQRGAEDAVATAERDLWSAWETRDRIETDFRAGTANRDELDRALTTLAATSATLGQRRAELKSIAAQPEPVRPNRADSALAVARAELGVARAALEKTRIRSPLSGVVLTVKKLAGDFASPAPEDIVFTVGDTTLMRVRVEVDERDATGIKLGQDVVIRSDAFASAEFAAHVTDIGAVAKSRTLLGRPPDGVPGRGVVEVLAEITSASPLLPGMKVDAFFKTTSPKQNKELSDATR